MQSQESCRWSARVLLVHRWCPQDGQRTAWCCSEVLVFLLYKSPKTWFFNSGSRYCNQWFPALQIGAVNWLLSACCRISRAWWQWKQLIAGTKSYYCIWRFINPPGTCCHYRIAALFLCWKHHGFCVSMFYGERFAFFALRVSVKDWKGIGWLNGVISHSGCIGTILRIVWFISAKLEKTIQNKKPFSQRERLFSFRTYVKLVYYFPDCDDAGNRMASQTRSSVLPVPTRIVRGFFLHISQPFTGTNRQTHQFKNSLSPRQDSSWCSYANAPVHCYTHLFST